MIKKIIIVDPNEKGGHNTYSHSLANILSNNNITYINRSIDNNINYNYTYIGTSSKSNSSKLHSYINLYKYLRKYINEDSILHFQAINYFMMIIIILLRITSIKKFNFFYTLHNIKPHSTTVKENIKYKLLKYLISLSMFKRIIYHYEFYNEEKNSKNLKKDVNDKMFFIPHHMFDKTIIKNKKNVNDKINILLFGVIRENKGIIEFFKLLENSNIDTKKINFIVAGKFVDYSKENLLNIIQSFENTLNIEITDGFISEEEKKKLFKKSHYLLLPYKQGFLAQSGLVLDAYQYQIPLIVSQNIALKYQISIEKTGLSFSDHNINDLFNNKLFDNLKYNLYLDNISYILENKYSNEYIVKEYIKNYIERD